MPRDYLLAKIYLLSFEITMKNYIDTCNLNKYQASRLVNLAPATLALYRQRGWLVEGIHYCKVNPRLIRYSESMLKEWKMFDYDTKRHLEYLDLYKDLIDYPQVNHNR